MNIFTELWDDFISLLFPRLCCGCGEPLVRNENVVCTSCLVEIPLTGYHLCRGNPAEQLFWGRCLVEKAAAYSFYTRGSRIRKIIHKLKYDGVEEAGKYMGRVYALSLRQAGFFNDIDLIMPVPLHPDKLKKRGFNQCSCICAGISEIAQLPVDSSTLIRSSISETQTRKSRYERWLNVEGIFQLSDPGKLKGKHVLLVDDVITTGSTIEACINALSGAEGIKVSVIALAVAVQ